MTKRNDKCPCGSGKKYKLCCLQTDLETEREKITLKSTDKDIEEIYEESPSSGIPTWKIFIAVTVILGIIALIVSFVLDFPRAGGALFGCGMLILIMYAAFRNVPSVRKNPGNAANLDFGNRP